MATDQALMAPTVDGGAFPLFQAFELSPLELRKEEQVGDGGTSIVYRGRFREQVVAIKEIEWNAQMTKTEAKDLKAFEREMAILPKLMHENLVRFVGVVSFEMPFRIVSEFCYGGDCFDLLHMLYRELHWQQQVKILRDTSLGMHYLHSNKPQIIHRDLKSLNLLLANPITSTQDEVVVKISDFGLSRMRDTDTTAGTPVWGKMTRKVGSDHWMAPEVFSGTRYDEKVDMYSFSMIIYELVAREIPFEDEAAADIGQLTLKGLRPDLAAVHPDCPAGLQQLMVDCWQAIPRNRPGFDDIVKRIQQINVPDRIIGVPMGNAETPRHSRRMPQSK